MNTTTKATLSLLLLASTGMEFTAECMEKQASDTLLNSSMLFNPAYTRISLSPEYVISFFACSTDGTRIVAGKVSNVKSNTVLVYDTTTGNALMTLEGYEDSICSTGLQQLFSPCANFVLLGFANGMVGMWDLEKNRIAKLSYAHSDKVTAVAYSPHGETFITASQDGTAQVWDAVTQLRLKTLLEVNEINFPYAFTITLVMYSPDIHSCGTSNNGNQFFLVDLTTGTLISKLKSDSFMTNKVAFSSDSRFFAYPLDGGKIGVWDLANKTMSSLLKYNIQSLSIQ